MPIPAWGHRGDTGDVAWPGTRFTAQTGDRSRGAGTGESHQSHVPAPWPSPVAQPRIPLSCPGPVPVPASLLCPPSATTCPSHLHRDPPAPGTPGSPRNTWSPPRGDPPPTSPHSHRWHPAPASMLRWHRGSTVGAPGCRTSPHRGVRPLHRCRPPGFLAMGFFTVFAQNHIARDFQRAPAPTTMPGGQRRGSRGSWRLWRGLELTLWELGCGVGV